MSDLDPQGPYGKRLRKKIVLLGVLLLFAVVQLVVMLVRSL